MRITEEGYLQIGWEIIEQFEDWSYITKWDKKLYKVDTETGKFIEVTNN